MEFNHVLALGLFLDLSALVPDALFGFGVERVCPQLIPQLRLSAVLGFDRKNSRDVTETPEYVNVMYQARFGHKDLI